jgi:hypothetical protein
MLCENAVNCTQGLLTRRPAQLLRRRLMRLQRLMRGRY